MASFQNIQGKTLEQISKNVTKIVMGDLVDFIKEYGGKVAKDTNRATVVNSAQALVDGLLEKKRDSETKANGKKDRNAISISAKGWTMIEAIRQALEDFNDTSVSVEDMATETNTPEPSVQKTMDVLERDGFLILEAASKNGQSDKYSFSEMGKTAKAPDSKSKAKTGTATKARGKTGPTSSNVGKKIKMLVKSNPSREGTRRAKAWDVLKNGMTYEAFIEAGGNAFDLKVFLMTEKISLS